MNYLKKCLISLSFIFLLTGCTKDETSSYTSYLEQFVTDDTTILTSFDLFDEKEVTEERVLQQLDIVMDVLEKEYEVTVPETLEPNQVYEVVSKDEAQDIFKVYYINDTGYITAKRTFIDDAIEFINQKELETGESFYAPIKWGTVLITEYDIGKANIQETDTEYIKKAEEYIQSLLPYINFEDYTLKVSEGDAGQMRFNYYTDEAIENDEIYDLSWISPLMDTNIDIGIGDRDLLDKFLYNE